MGITFTKMMREHPAIGVKAIGRKIQKTKKNETTQRLRGTCRLGFEFSRGVSLSPSRAGISHQPSAQCSRPPNGGRGVFIHMHIHGLGASLL